jgi:dephospho-CoA kinase
VSSRWPKKLIVGLTGNIATGKSVVLQFAAGRGALALDADHVVHEILMADEEVQSEIAMVFGDAVRQPDGPIDREALASIVFDDATALRELERIVHPRVREQLFERIEGSSQPIVMIEAIKLFEGGLAAECDEIWVTRCPVETQIERLVTIRGMDRKTAEMRVRAQSSQEKKVALADVVIDTAGDMNQTLAQAALAWRRLVLKLPESAIEEASPAPEPDDVATPRTSQGETGLPGSQELAGGEVEKEDDAGPRDEEMSDGIIVRRARPTDIPAILLLIHQATDGAVQMSRGELLLALGDRGYLIGQQGTAISTIAGWTAENQIASIDQLFVYPPGFAKDTGAAVLREIENTANELLCEVILAPPGEGNPEEIRQLFSARGFEYVDPESLPMKWREAVAGYSLQNDGVMLKQLLVGKDLHLRKIKRS